MWLLTGPFDSASNDTTTTKTKFLPTGTKVTLGRKDRPLVVNNKKISRDHCEFIVGPCTPEDVSNPSFVPALQIHNAKDKAMSIDRDGQAQIVNPLSSSELKSGDKINIVAGVAVEAQWRRIACFLPPARSVPSISNEDCATLGISLVTSPDSLATHHFTPKYELTVPLATSLLSATQLVRVEWLQELIHLGTTPDDGHPFKQTPLEQTFHPPPESKYRPIFSPSLPPLLKSFKFWEPNEERLHLLKGYRFVLLSDGGGQVDENTRELVQRGDGEYEYFPLTNGEAKWRQLLGKAKRKVDEFGLKVAIVAREQVVRATVGEDKWREMSAEAQSLSLPVINVDTLLNAIINTDPSFINEGTTSQADAAEESSPLPDFIPNTHPDEPSIPAEPEKAPEEPHEAGRGFPSPSPPPALFGLPIPPPPNKNLIRRVKPVSTASVVPDTKDESQADDLEYTLPPILETKPSAKLKRRAPTPAPPAEELSAVIEQDKEPPHKKFKALFDATAPEAMDIDRPNLRDAYDAAVEGSTGLTQGESFTQSDTRPPHTQTVALSGKLEVVAEEEEEESGHTQVRIIHRKSPEQHASQAYVEASQGSGTKRKATSTAKPPSEKPHRMDTDPAFLTAIASKKKKKTGEDDFDREFNKLRISKPDIHREDEEQAWDVLGDFDVESRNVQGNFMVIIDLEVFRPNRGDASVVNRTYDGVVNFKKFKKTPTPSSRVPVELVAKGEQDYGMGSGYWKDGATQKDQASLPLTQTTLDSQKRSAPTVLESDGAESDVPALKSTKRARKAPRSKATATGDKLFLNSDGEDNGLEAGPRGKSRPDKADAAPRGSKRRHIIVDDDSDDGVAFKGFGKKRRI